MNVYCQLNRQDENKEKEAVNGPFFKQLTANKCLIKVAYDLIRTNVTRLGDFLHFGQF